MRCLHQSIGNSLGGSPVDDRSGRDGWRDRENFGVKVLSEVVLLAHGTGGGRLDGSITCYKSTIN
eukprot:5577031-Ditylum_brightwellii.AAC.1